MRAKLSRQESYPQENRKPGARSLTLDLILTCCGTLTKQHSFLEPQFPHYKIQGLKEMKILNKGLQASYHKMPTNGSLKG